MVATGDQGVVERRVDRCRRCGGCDGEEASDIQTERRGKRGEDNSQRRTEQDEEQEQQQPRKQATQVASPEPKKLAEPAHPSLRLCVSAFALPGADKEVSLQPTKKKKIKIVKQ